MKEDFQLKAISHDAVDSAIAKAKHYRDLNDPEQAESICLDVLAVEPNQQQALVVLTLAISDQFRAGGSFRGVQRALRCIGQLTDPYARAYYTGIVHERKARALLDRNMARASAYEPFRDAMDSYEAAEAMRPAGNDDAILRWNSCVRSIRHHGLEPPRVELELPLE